MPKIPPPPHKNINKDTSFLSGHCMHSPLKKNYQFKTLDLEEVSINRDRFHSRCSIMHGEGFPSIALGDSTHPHPLKAT